MSKSRSFSIYLLKKSYTAENSLKEDHKLGDPIKANNLPENATLYILDTEPQPPWWKSFWGIEEPLTQVSKGALVFLPVKDRCFALSFGNAYHKLEEYCYEYDFGLRVSLNALYPEKLKSTDVLEPSNAKRQRIQSPTASDLTFFDFDRDSSILKSLAGKVKNDLKDLFSNITGASNLKISSKVQPEGLEMLCETLGEIYHKEDYKTSFPEIQNISPVKDPQIINKLNDSLLNGFKNSAINLVLTIPDLIDYKDNFLIYFSGTGKSLIYEDVFIDHYREYLISNEFNIEEMDIETLNSHTMNLCNDDEEIKERFSIFKSLLYESSLDGNQYHLCEGHWYHIEDDYIKKLESFLDPYFEKSNLFMDYTHKSEGEYNEACVKQNIKFICLDKKNISPNKQTQVEPCDIYYIQEQTAFLCHVKVSTRSSTLSHLFNQGVNAVQLIRLEKTSKEKLKILVENNLNGNDKKPYLEPIEEEDFQVSYVIITHKDTSEKSNNLPIFSRISLMRCLKALKLMGIKSKVYFVNDKTSKKTGKQKEKHISKKKYKNVD